MRSLRARYFLVVWPLIVATLIGVGVYFRSWASAEIERFDAPRSGHLDSAVIDGVTTAIGDRWSGTAPSDRPELLERILEETGLRGSINALLLGPTGVVLSGSDSILRSARARAAGADGADGYIVEIARAQDGRVVANELRMIGGRAVSIGPEPLGRMFAWAAANAGEVPTPQEAIEGARQTLWVGLVMAALASACITLLLSSPVVRRLQRLSDATRRLASGGTEVRVPVGSRDELGALETSVNDLAIALGEAHAAKQRLVSDVAHELRTPLTNIIALLESVRDGLRAPDVGMIDSIHEEAALLKALVEDLQDLTLAESGALAFAAETVDLAAVAEQAIRGGGEAARHLSLNLERDDPPILAIADQRRVAQILRNLLTNAIRHTPPGGRIRVRVTRDGFQAVVIVSDTGEGIPGDQLSLIWDRFHRVDSSRSRSTGGMGLGLALVRQFARAMEGDASVRSTLGVGSEFEVRLPLAGGP